MLIVLGRQIIRRLRHKSLFLCVTSVFPSTRRAVISAAAAIAEPQKHDDLANQHADGAGDQTCQDTQDSGNHDEADNAREGPLPPAVVHMVVVVGRPADMVRTRTTMAPERWPHTFGEGFRRVPLQTRLTMAALGDGEPRGRTHHPSLCIRNQSAEAGNQEHLQALGLSTALLPRETVWTSLFDLGSGNI